MTSGEKIAALDNLENLYSSAITYIDAITHASMYYTDAECVAKYFSLTHQGTGTGLIAMTLDGMSADQIINSGTPSGIIAWWSGSEASIPSGWVLCDGINAGTPNLRNRFVVGAGSHYNRGDPGGSNTVTTTATVAIAGHALAASEVPLHNHGTITDYYALINSSSGNSSTSSGLLQTATDHASYTGYAGSGGAHGHTASFEGSASQDKRPKLYALCYIMKS